jgi:hypothetical protein
MGARTGAAVRKGVYYPLADSETPPASAGQRAYVRAKWITGEYRTPKKGEWFLSGAIVEAYEAKADLTTVYHIAELVDTRNVHWVVTRDGKPLASLASEDDAHAWLLRYQGQSTDWAMKYEGYAITEVNNNA